MSLKKSTGNMYKWITHTWNPVRGKCPYNCAYCYVDRWGRPKTPIHLDERELKTNLGEGNFIFVCSGCDLFNLDVPWEWIAKVFDAARRGGNAYLWHTKNPARAVEIPLWQYPSKSTLCVTIESNVYRPCISAAPPPSERAESLMKWKGEKMITVEPVMDFDLAGFTDLILSCKPGQVNIGADSGKNGLPEPPAWKIGALVKALEDNGITVHLKKNLNRLAA
jgi:DNA repair photolyase